MQKVQELRNQQQEKISQLLKSVGVFWAFSNQQFHENKTPLKEGEKYVSIGGGGYMPKSQVENLTTGMKEIKNWFTQEINKSKELRKDLIAYELHNHEAFYTGEIDQTLEALGPGYTEKEVWAVYKVENQKNIENGIY